MGLPFYFPDPHTPWQQGTNKNANGLPREYLLKSLDIALFSLQDSSINPTSDLTNAWVGPPYEVFFNPLLHFDYSRKKNRDCPCQSIVSKQKQGDRRGYVRSPVSSIIYYRTSDGKPIQAFRLSRAFSSIISLTFIRRVRLDRSLSSSFMVI